MRWIGEPFRFLALVIVIAACSPLHALSQDLAAETPPLGQPATSASIPLRQGWNLVASPLIPDNPAPAAILASIAGQYETVYAYDGCDAADPWKIYDPNAPSFANDLSSIGVERGLWIKATSDTLLTVTGTPPAQPGIPLCAGQNLIGYPSSESVLLPDALASLAGKYSGIRAFDAADATDPWKIFDPQSPPFVNDIKTIGPAKGYWLEMKEPALLQVSPLDSAARRVNVPYFDPAGRYSEMAVFWFGRVTPTDNYADVRVGYTSQELILNVATFDRRLWYDDAPSPGDLTAWDAVTLYLSLDDGAGATLGSNAYRFVGQLTWWEAPRTPWQAAYRYDGAAWSPTNLTFSTSSGWRGDAPNTDVDDRGWNLSFVIPFSSLGRSSAPAPGTDWRLALVLHDRDDAAGTSIPDETWPEALSAASPTTWGVLGFGVPTYTPPAATPGGAVTIRHKLNGATVTDAAVGGYAVCGAGTDFWTQWGETTEAFYNAARDRFNVQNQEDISDWPCFSKYYITFPLTGVPAGKTIISSTLILYQIGNAGEGWTPGPEPSYIQVLTTDQDWNESSLTWNNAPLADENVAAAWVDPLPSFPGWPGVPRRWDLSRAVAQAYAAGRPLRLIVYSADAPYHSGRYFTASDIEDWDEVGRPTLTVTWGEPGR